MAMCENQGAKATVCGTEPLPKSEGNHSYNMLALFFFHYGASTARVVQGDPSRQGKHWAGTKTECGSNTVEKRGWPQERRDGQEKVGAQVWNSPQSQLSHQKREILKVGKGNLISNDSEGISDE